MLLALDARTGRVFVTTTDEQALPPQGRVSVLDAATGTLVGTLAFRAMLGLLLVDAHAGHVFVTMTRVDRKGAGIAPGQVAMLDARSGRILHTATVGANPTAMALDARHGRLIVATTGEREESLPNWPPRGEGHVSVIDTASGRILREVSVGMDPFAVAVDGRTGRAMVLARGGTIRVRPSDPWSWLPSWFRGHVPLFAPAMTYRDRAVPATVSIVETAP
jgi:DNA-binding beta-propeller fold protein YncE